MRNKKSNSYQRNLTDGEALLSITFQTVPMSVTSTGDEHAHPVISRELPGTTRARRLARGDKRNHGSRKPHQGSL